QASLTGSGRLTTTVRELLRRSPTLADYDVDGALALQASEVRGVRFDSGHVEASLRDSTLSVAQIEVSGGAVEGSGRGAIPFGEAGAFDFEYDPTRVDLGELRPLHGRDIVGLLASKGRLTGSSSSRRLAGSGTIGQLRAFDVSALTVSAEYDTTVPAEDPAR